MSKKLAIIHTTPATIQSLTELAKELFPEVELIHMLDDSMLHDMVAKRSTDKVEQRWLTYADMAVLAGADVVLSACSTVGEFAEKADQALDIPVLRIDDAMAAQAVDTGKKIAVFATLQSTLDPTVSLIRRKAAQKGCDCEVTTNLVEGAYEQLMAGNKDEHNRRIKDAVADVIDSVDVVVLAQASMAGALAELSEEAMKKVLTSPRSGMTAVKEVMNR